MCRRSLDDPCGGLPLISVLLLLLFFCCIMQEAGDRKRNTRKEKWFCPFYQSILNTHSAGAFFFASYYMNISLRKTKQKSTLIILSDANDIVLMTYVPASQDHLPIPCAEILKASCQCVSRSRLMKRAKCKRIGSQKTSKIVYKHYQQYLLF